MSTTAFTLALVAAWSSGAPAGSSRPFAQFFQSALVETDDPLIFRGQSPATGPVLGPIQDETTTYYQPTPTYSDPNAVFGAPGAPMVSPSPMMAPAPIGGDPWLGGTPGMPYAAPMQPSPNYTYGVHGAQPYRFGWTARYDFGFMPSVGTSSPNVDDLSLFTFDLEKEYVKPLPSSWIFSIAPQFNWRSVDGPLGTATQSNLPPNLYRIGLGLKLASPEYNGSTFEVGFDPAYASDFELGSSSESWQFDAHAVWFWRWNPNFMVALGAAYWDRLDDLIIPYAGVVYTPNDYLEFRLLFPEPRISLFLGTPNGVATWAYVYGEYHVESYAIDQNPPGARDQVQFSDWRVLGGMRFETGWLTSFVEAGIVFDREVQFDRAASTNFDVDSGFIGRAGFRY